MQFILCSILIGTGIFMLFTASPPVTLSWETGSETNTAGFNIYRAEAQGSTSTGPWIKVNPTLVPAKGSEVVGATYRFEDAGAVPGRRYYYRIEEIEWNGSATLYPNTVVVRAGLPEKLTTEIGLCAVLLGLGLLGWELRKHLNGQRTSNDNRPESGSGAS